MKRISVILLSSIALITVIILLKMEMDKFFTTKFRSILKSSDQSKELKVVVGTIKIDSLNQLYLNDIKINQATLEQKLSKLGHENPTSIITFNAPKSIPVSRIMELMSLCQANNLKLELSPI